MQAAFLAGLTDAAASVRESPKELPPDDYMDGDVRMWKSDRNDQVCHCWQDVSVRTWGATAQDVADNFVQRWNHTRARETSSAAAPFPATGSPGNGSACVWPQVRTKAARALTECPSARRRSTAKGRRAPCRAKASDVPTAKGSDG